MHDEALDFVRETFSTRQPLLGGRVVELGSFDVNGTIRVLFPEASEYVGVDCHPGPGVDVVGLAKDVLADRLGQFDVCVSTEMLEHDPWWRESLARGLDLLRPGGLLVVTCAGPNRAPHNPDESPVQGYYANVSADDMRAWAADHGIVSQHATQVRGDMDTHFWAERP